MSSSVSEPWFGKPLVSGKTPIQKNLFEEVIHATDTLELVPVFPYLDNGSTVSCLSVSIGRPGTQKFQFFHNNVVQEVLICLAGQNACLQAGQMMVLPNQHGVTDFLQEPEDEDAYFVVLITIRMNQHADQREEFLIRCEKCKGQVCKSEADVKTRPDRPCYPEFYALSFYAAATDEFNASDRICPKCDYVQAPFPAEQVRCGATGCTAGGIRRGKIDGPQMHAAVV